MYATAIKLLKLVKIPLNVALQKSDITNWLFLCVILTSKKESHFLIETPSICLYMTWSKMNNDSYTAKIKSSLMSLWSKLWIVLVSQNKSAIQMSITSFKGLLVNRLLITRLAMKWSGQKLESSSVDENESCTEKSLDVRGDKIGTKNLAN